MHSTTQINITHAFSPFIFMVLLLILWTVSYYFYRRTIPPISKPLRWLCLSLRGFALSLILWMLFRPMLHLIHHREVKPKVAVLIDESASMTIRDNLDDRATQVQHFLKSSIYDEINDWCDFETQAFSDDIHALSQDDTLSFKGSATNITQALNQTLSQERGQPLRGILLLSDGAHNMGALPENRKDLWHVPIYSVAFGRAQEKPDIILTDMEANEIAYAGIEMPVKVTLRGPGLGGKTVRLTLYAGQQEISQVPVTLPSQGLETTVTFKWTPRTTGDIRLRVLADTLDGELISSNNTREMYVQIRQSKHTVLMISGSPGPDIGFLRRLYEKDDHIDFRSRTQRNDGRFYEGILSGTDILSADMMIFLDFPTRQTPGSIWNLLQNTFQQKNMPLLVIAGKSIDEGMLNKLPIALPIHSLGPYSAQWIAPRLSAQGVLDPIPNINENVKSQTAWSNLPPIVTFWPKPSVMPDAKILVEGRSENYQNQSIPFIVSRSLNGQKSVMILGSLLFKWQMLMWQEGETKDMALQFFLNCYRWLIADESVRPVRLQFTDRVIRAGAPIVFNAEVYDETLRPTDQAAVQARITGQDTFQVNMRSQGNGLYQASLPPMISGEYKVTADALLQGRLLGKDTTKFTISTFQPEFLQTRAQPELLAQLSSQSGGISVTPDSIDALEKAMRFPLETLVTEQDIKPAQHPAFLILIIVLLSAEWWIRRRKGMV